MFENYLKRGEENSGWFFALVRKTINVRRDWWLMTHFFGNTNFLTEEKRERLNMMKRTYKGEKKASRMMKGRK